MILLAVRVPAGDEAAVGAVGPGDGAVGVDLSGVGPSAVGQAAVFEYATAVGAGLSLPEGLVGGAGVGTVSIGDSVPSIHWPRGQDEQQ